MQLDWSIDLESASQELTRGTGARCSKSTNGNDIWFQSKRGLMSNTKWEKLHFRECYRASKFCQRFWMSSTFKPSCMEDPFWAFTTSPRPRTRQEKKIVHLRFFTIRRGRRFIVMTAIWMSEFGFLTVRCCNAYPHPCYRESSMITSMSSPLLSPTTVLQ